MLWPSWQLPIAKWVQNYNGRRATDKIFSVTDEENGILCVLHKLTAEFSTLWPLYNVPWPLCYVLIVLTLELLNATHSLHWQVLFLYLLQIYSSTNGFSEPQLIGVSANNFVRSNNLLIHSEEGILLIIFGLTMRIEITGVIYQASTSNTDGMQIHSFVCLTYKSCTAVRTISQPFGHLAYNWYTYYVSSKTFP